MTYASSRELRMAALGIAMNSAQLTGKYMIDDVIRDARKIEQYLVETAPHQPPPTCETGVASTRLAPAGVDWARN